MHDIFEYNPGEGGKWWVKPTPIAPPWFQAELTLLAGVSDRGQPNLRAVWGGSVLHDITEKPQLKYKVVREIINGYNYIKEDGTVGITQSMNLPKDAKVPWEFAPRKERIEMGRLRWAIEKHVPAHELRRLGRFQNRYAPDGEKILRELPPEGVYDHFFWVQSKDYKYRELDEQVLTAVKAMFQYELTASEAQKTLDAIEGQEKNLLIGADQARKVWAELP